MQMVEQVKREVQIRVTAYADRMEKAAQRQDWDDYEKFKRQAQIWTQQLRALTLP